MILLVGTVLALYSPVQNKFVIGINKVPKWSPDQDSNLSNQNITLRKPFGFFNNQSNLSAGWNLNITNNFTLDLAMLGITGTFDNTSVRVYEVNTQGFCLNASGVYNGSCESIPFEVIA